METEHSALNDACAAVGGATKLAELLTLRMGRTVSKASISRWKKERVPAEACPDIEALTGVKCERLRHDVNWTVLRTPVKKSAAAQSRPADETAAQVVKAA